MLFILACKKGSFGIDCNETCGHCRDINKCSNVHGTCLTGCADGYEGNLCNARKYTVTCTTKHSYINHSRQLKNNCDEKNHNITYIVGFICTIQNI